MDSKDVAEKIKNKDKSFITNVLDQLYVICRETGRDCTTCPFEWDEKLKFEFGYENQSVEMCPLDIALIEYKSPEGNRGKIHPWVYDNLEMIYKRLQELKAS